MAHTLRRAQHWSQARLHCCVAIHVPLILFRLETLQNPRLDFFRHFLSSPLPPLSDTWDQHTDRGEAAEINSDLNVLSWCVSVVKASVKLGAPHNHPLKDLLPFSTCIVNAPS